MKCTSMGYIIALTYTIVSTTAFSCLAADQAASAEDLTYITEQLPPFNYQKDGEVQGISVDLLEKMWEIMDVDLNSSVIKLLPWTDGYQRTLKENNTVLFMTDRIPEREQLFKWVGPAVPGMDVLWAKRDRNINITVPEDLKKYKIGAIEDDSTVQKLLNNGVKIEDLILETSSKTIIEMLETETIDAWAYGNITGIWLIQESGANADDYEIAYVLGLYDNYYAFNKGVPDCLVQSFQQALDSIKSSRDNDGVTEYDKILSKNAPLKA